MTFDALPHINAGLNSLSTLLLLTGFVAIRSKKVWLHHRCMLGALTSSALFLVCYLVYHYNAGRTTFRDPAWFRPYYLVLLLTHTVLAVVIVPMVLVTLRRALRGDFVKHRALARWTWPLWMYVSVTGVLVYLILYHWFPQERIPMTPAG